MKWIGVAAVVFLLLAPAAQAAKPGTVTGKLEGAKLPAASNGQVPVWALRLTDGVVVAATTAKRGRFSLRAPKGHYAILATIVLEEGRKQAVHRVADFVSSRAGKRVKIKPSFKPKRARAAWRNVDYPVIWVHKWASTGGDPELKVMEKGMQAMVITDLVNALDKPGCRGAVSAGDDLGVVLAEVQRSQSKYFDPSTRMTTKNWLRPNASVTGTLSTAGGQTTVTATYTDQRNGRSGTMSVTGPEANIFALEEQLMRKLVALICTETPKAYAGTFSGTYTTPLNDLTVTWTGDAVIELLAENGGPPPSGPEGTYAHYVVRSGTVHAKLEGTRGVCTAAGEATIALHAGMDSGLQYVESGAEAPWFALAIAAYPTDQIPYTETGSGCQDDAAYPLTGLRYAFTEPTLQATDVRHLTGNTSATTSFSHVTSAFTFSATD
jgi:hypothetical protein